MSDKADHSSGGHSQVYLLFTTSLMLVVMVGFVVQVIHGLFGLAITELFLILLPALVFAWSKKLPAADALRWKAIASGTAVLCLVAGVCTWGIVAGVNEVISRATGKVTPERATVFNFTEWLLVIVCAAALPAFCEESLFRGAIQGTLRRLGARRAITVTAVLFGIYHLDPVELLPLVLMGLSYGMICWRTNSSFASMLAHFANNAIAVTAPRIIHNENGDYQVWIMLGCAVSSLVVFPLFWKHTRTIPAETPRLAHVPAAVTRHGWIVAGVAGVLSLALWIGAAIVVGVYLMLFINMPDDSMTPRIGNNDRLVILRGDYIPLNLKANDLVAVQAGETMTMRRVVGVGTDFIRLADNQRNELKVPLLEIRGKLIHNFKRPAGEISSHPKDEPK